jgi:hypothetical protein
LEGRHQPEQRQPQHSLDFVGILDSRIEIFEAKAQTDAQQQAREETDLEVSPQIGARRGPRHFRRIDDANVARFQVAGDICLAAALQQSREHRLVGRRITGQDAVLGGGAVQLLGFRTLLVKRRLQGALVRLSGQVVVANGLHDLLHFTGQTALGGINCRLDAGHVGVTHAEFLAELPLLTLQLVEFDLELLNERVVENRRERIETRAIGLNPGDLVVG